MLCTSMHIYFYADVFTFYVMDFQVITKVAKGTAEDVNRAVNAAHVSKNCIPYFYFI